MSVEAPSVNDVFRVTVIKHLTTNPARGWANTYELRAISALETADLRSAAVSIASFEATMSLTNVVFDRVVLSTWEAEGTYIPGNFITQDLELAGLRSFEGQDACSLEHVLKIRRNPAVGRYGNIFLRGALAESQVNAPAGSLRLSDATMVDLLEDAIEVNLGWVLPGGVHPCRLVMRGVSKDSIVSTREVLSLSLGGVGLAKVSHRYFNRDLVTAG